MILFNIICGRLSSARLSERSHSLGLWVRASVSDTMWLRRTNMKIVMNLDEAKKIWGDAMTDEELKKWLEMKNKRRPELDDPRIPKGATVEIGKAVYRPND